MADIPKHCSSRPYEREDIPKNGDHRCCDIEKRRGMY